MTLTETVESCMCESREEDLTLRRPIRAKILYSLNSLRLASQGVICGPMAERLDPGLTMEAEVAITARWRTETGSERDGVRRIRRYLVAGSGYTALPVVQVQVRCSGTPEEAISAIRKLAGEAVKFPWMQGADLVLAGTAKALEKDLMAKVWAAVHANCGVIPFLDEAFGELMATETVVELHLPFPDRKRPAGAGTKPHWKAITEPGRVFLHEFSPAAPYEAANRYQAFLAVTGAVSSRFQDRPAWAISFRDTRRFPGRQALFSLAPLLEFYNLDDAARHWLALAAATPETEVEAAWCLQAPPAAAGVWLDVPSEQTAEFFRLLTEVSKAAQRALRAWLPYVFFHRLKRFEDTESALPLLVYASSAPNRPRGRNEYTYDPMEEKSVRRAMWRIQEGLRDTLAGVHGMLASNGRASLAASYAPWMWEHLACQVKKSPHEFRALLAMDEYFVEALIRFALAGHEIGQRVGAGGGESRHRTSRMATAFTRSTQARLGSLYGGVEFPGLPPLLLVEGTCGLYSALHGMALRPAALLRLRRIDNGHEAVFAGRPTA